MGKEGQSQPPSLVLSKQEAIQHLKDSIAKGKHWYIALLEAISLWTLPEETYQEYHYQYLIDGQAFDFFLLAERLCEEVNSLIPEEEKIELLFGKPPIDLSSEEFKALIGNEKYRACLNYFYGITVEQALQSAVAREIEKEQQTKVNRQDYFDLAFRRIYGADELTLLAKFRQEKGYPQSNEISLSELNEFNYWLFKYRLKNCDKARVASDTKKALNYLEYIKGERRFLF